MSGRASAARADRIAALYHGVPRVATCARRGDGSHRTPHRSRVSSPIRRC